MLGCLSSLSRDSLDQPHPPGGACDITTCKKHTHSTILTLAVNVVGHNILEVNGISLSHAMQVKKVEMAEHSSAVSMACNYLVKEGVYVFEDE